MTAVITGDIINSRAQKASKWLPILKKVLNKYGQTPGQWEIYRGDSFQLELAPQEALKAALYIKASIRQTSNLDVRMAIGIGDKTHQAQKITESNGSAFIHSGECFETLKKQTLAVKSPNPKLDEAINLLLALALLTINNWSTVTSLVVKASIENPQKNQKELAALLGKSQSNISETLKRAGFEEVIRLEEKYRTLINEL